MSSTIETATTPADKSVRQLPWGLWAQQTLAILQLELRKNFLSRRALLIYVLAALPVFLLFLLAIIPPDADEFGNFNDLTLIFSVIYNTLILRAVVFFGCAWIFMNLFRGEVVDRSLHYYFLSPVRREVLVVGKYLSGLVTAIVLFGLTTLLSLFMLYFPRFSAESSRYFFEGAGGKQALIYLGITTLAVIGYGAIFMIVGLFFRNPIIPALLIYGWEWINFLLPPLLKKASVIHYLHSLMPVPMSEGPFAMLAEATSAWRSVPGLLLFTLIVLVLAGYHARRMEISYVGD
jgi:ABC-type transport system involved in multi-copper enzyme maturation permease subunit